MQNSTKVYLRGIESAMTRRVRELKLFSKVILKPAAPRVLIVQLSREELGDGGPNRKFAMVSGLHEILARVCKGNRICQNLNRLAFSSVSAATDPAIGKNTVIRWEISRSFLPAFSLNWESIKDTLPYKQGKHPPDHEI